MALSKTNRPFKLPNPYRDPVRRGAVTLVRPMAERMLNFRKLNKVYASVHRRSSDVDFFERVLDELRISIDIDDSDLRRVPKTGPLIVVANHPFGAIEGMALATILKRARPDVKLLANFLLRVLPDLDDDCFYVDPFDRPDSRRQNFTSMRAATRWVRDGGVLGVFPAGEVSHATWRRLHVSDPPWSETVGRLVQRTGAPVLPVFFSGRNGVLFQLAGLLHPRLRTVLLPRELLKKRDREIRATIGSVIPHKRLTSFASPRELTTYLRVRTYLIKQSITTDVESRRRSRQIAREQSEREPIADPTDPELLRAEVAALPREHLLYENESYRVFYARAMQIPNLLREIGRERERAFREVGEGTGRALDVDAFDAWYIHLILWSREAEELVGAYRAGPTDEILPTRGVEGLYSSTLFSFRGPLLRQIDPALELGRSFVRIEYQRKHAPLMLLWRGIGLFVAANPRYRMVFGPVSITNEYQSMSKKLLIGFLEAHRSLASLGRMLEPRHPVRLKPIRDWDPQDTSVVVRDMADVDELIRDIEVDRRGLPVLLRQYLKLDAKLLAFNIDPEFGSVLDGLMLADIASLERRVLDHYMGRERAAAFLAFHGREVEEAGG